MPDVAVLFPGIGYTCEKPLLYYAAKAAAEAGYEVIRAAYGNFPQNVKGDPQKMRECFESALEQAETLLQTVDWSRCGRIVFIGKSIGTAVAARYAEKYGLTVGSVLLTPLKETVDVPGGTAIAFHGTADPWAKTDEIAAACAERGIPLYLTNGANHSLETGDVSADLKTLEQTTKLVRLFLEEYRPEMNDGGSHFLLEAFVQSLKEQGLIDLN